VNTVGEALQQHQLNGTYRSLVSANSLVDFASNDYLGLSRSSYIRARLIGDLQNGCAMGATGSRLLSGQTDVHQDVEQFLQSIFDVPSALIFSSGYLANLGVLTAFGTLPAHFFCDELNHASLIDGVRLSRSAKTVFHHNDLNDLEAHLRLSTASTKVIVTESVFSMDGDLAPLSAIKELALQYSAWVVIDEAHATGAFGKRGLGCLELGHRDWPKLVTIHTGGKALGGQGAFVLSDHDFRNLLINRARSFIFNTALAPLSVLQIQYAIEEILAHPELPKMLRRNSEFCRSLLGEFASGSSQIIPVRLGSNEKALDVAAQLQQLGYDVRAIRSPTVPIGSERLRVTIKSFTENKTIENFCCALRKLL
jgi:8-amino-7-oxononanoate synthase